MTKLKTETSVSADAPVPAGSKKYHLIIFISAACVLLVGGLWRGGNQEEAIDSQVSGLDVLREEVSGLQSALKKDELRSIQAKLAEVAKRASRVTVAVMPAQAVEPVRPISVYGGPSERADEALPPILPPGVSGVLIDGEGHILTTSNATRFGTEFAVSVNGVRYVADFIGIDADDYLALLKLRDAPADLTPPEFEDVPLQPGQWLIRLGRSPENTETRSLCFLESLRKIAGDRIVGLIGSERNPEADGTVLVDVSGRIVGMYVTPNGTAGLVVPISRMQSVAMQMRPEHRPAPAASWFGMELQEMTADLQEYFGVPAGGLVINVVPLGPAARAGLRPMDVIQKIGDQPVTSAADAMAMLQAGQPGTVFRLAIQRASRSIEIEMTAEAIPVSEPPAAPADSLVLKLAAMPSVADGLVIVSAEPPTLASRAGIKAGDIIRSFDRARLRTVSQFFGLERRVPEGKSKLLEIRRGDTIFFVAVKERIAGS